MTIEFNCHVCGKLLRTSDDKAGRTAKCPGCGEAISVPGPGDESPAAEDDYAADEFGAEEYGTGAEEDYGGDEEFAAPTVTRPRRTGGTRTCPMCGEKISRTATRCEFCGEDLGPAKGRRRGEGRPTQIEAGEVISTAWEIFKSEMGICIGAWVVVGIILGAIGLGRALIQNAVVFGAGGMGGPAPRGGAVVMVFVVVYGLAFLEFLAQRFFWSGWIRLLLNVARGDNAEIGDLFSQGPIYLRYLGNSILFGLMVGIGTFLCIVPGVILWLMFWPFEYVLVDRKPPGIDCLSEAKEITDGNWGAVLLIVLAGIGINILGFLALCIGLLFTVPLTQLMFAVAYCRMTGQRTARV